MDSIVGYGPITNFMSLPIDFSNIYVLSTFSSASQSKTIVAGIYYIIGNYFYSPASSTFIIISPSSNREYIRIGEGLIQFTSETNVQYSTNSGSTFTVSMLKLNV